MITDADLVKHSRELLTRPSKERRRRLRGELTEMIDRSLDPDGQTATITDGMAAALSVL